jgi:hypothetical protein
MAYLKATKAVADETLDAVVLTMPIHSPLAQDDVPLSCATPAEEDAQRISPNVTLTVASRVTEVSPLEIHVVEELKTPMMLFDGVPVQFPMVFDAV